MHIYSSSDSKTDFEFVLFRCFKIEKLIACKKSYPKLGRI